jgi:hypothetical protein
VEEDTPKIVVSHTLKEDEIERGKVKIEKQQEWVEWPRASDGMIMTLIITNTDSIKYAATPPNQPQRCILTYYFNNYNLNELK